MSILDKFMVALGFQVDTEGMEKFERKTNELRDAAMHVGAVLTGAAVGIGLFVHEIAESMDTVFEFAELNQVSARSIEAMKLAGIDFQIGGDSMQDSLGNLNRKLGEAAAGIGRGAAIFKKLGLSAKDSSGHVRSLGDMLGVVADKMQGKSRAENIAIASRLGMDPKMVFMLEKGRAALQSMREEADKQVPLSEEDFELAHKVDVAFLKAQYSIGLISKMIAAQLMPWVLKALNYFQAWFASIRGSSLKPFTEALGVMGIAIGSIWTWSVRVVEVIRALVGWFVQFRIVTWAATAAVAALVAYKIGSFFIMLTKALSAATKAMLGFEGSAALPVIGLGLLIGAFILLVDELWAFYHGGDSLLGQLSKKYPYAVHIAWAALMTLVAAFVALKWTALVSLTETMALVAMYAAEWITAHAAMAVATIAAYWPILLIVIALGLVIAAIYLVWHNWDKITAWMKKAWGEVNDTLRDTWELFKKLSTKDKFKFVFDTATQNYADIATLGLPTGSSTPFANQKGGVLGKAAPGSTGNTQHIDNSTHTSPITVITSDPDKAGRNVQKTLDRRDRRIIRNGQTAVAQ